MMLMALKHEPGKMFRSLCYPDNWCDFHCKAVESFVAFHCILRFAVDRMGRFPTVSAWRANPLLLGCKGRSTQLEAQLHSSQPLHWWLWEQFALELRCRIAASISTTGICG